MSQHIDITFDEMKEILLNYYSYTNFPKKSEYILKFTNSEFKTLLKALCAHYVNHLAGRKRTKKGFDVDFMKIKILENVE